MPDDIRALRRRIEELEDRVTELEEALGMSLPVPPGFRGPYSRNRAWQLICGLARRGTLTRDQAMIVLYGDRHEDERPDTRVIDVLLSQTRPWLRERGITIETIWGVGWTLDRENRARAQALIEQLQADAAPP